MDNTDELQQIRAAIRRLRQANIAEVIRASTERNATEVEHAWADLARYADEPRAVPERRADA